PARPTTDEASNAAQEAEADRRAEAAAEAFTEGRNDEETLKAHVRSAYLSDYLGTFRQYRELLRDHDGGEDTTKVDKLLDNWRGMRDRRTARKIAGKLRAEATPSVLRAMPKLGIGSVLKDRFVLESELGTGGVGKVFKAVDRRRLELGSPEPYVAVKLLNPDFAADTEAVRALEREARKTQELAHQNIVNVYDFDRHAGAVFIVMEYLRGRTLLTAIHRGGLAGTSLQNAKSALDGAAAGLHHAHQHGLAHADVKPGNIFITEGGITKVLDFGLVAALLESATEADPEGLTPKYASPERVLGDPPSVRDDVFAFACVSYRYLSGRHPFFAADALEAYDMDEAFTPITHLPARRNGALAAALAFDAKERTSTIAEFRHQLLGD
ncbi:MAG: serine/threonine-protein kinase, partial [Pseudomonadota bacterium]